MTRPSDMELKRTVADCFRLLSACFYEPDKELFLQERLCENLAVLLVGCNCIKASNAAERMRSALAASGDDELRVEYARLFLGPFELVAPPYGSVYLDESRRLMGDSTMVVRKMYGEAGLTLQVKQAPDHIALELEFMHYLYLTEAEAAARNETDVVHGCAAMRAEFVGRLLGPWVPVFCGKIRQGTESVFYAFLAQCLADFITEISSGCCHPLLLPQGAKRHDCRISVERL